jgi:hypothetical protein
LRREIARRFRVDLLGPSPRAVRRPHDPLVSIPPRFLWFNGHVP